MPTEKLSSFISIFVALVILLASYFKWYDATWNGPVLLRKWVPWFFAVCIVLLLIAAYLLFVSPTSK
jgi:hypothetical protein